MWTTDAATCHYCGRAENFPVEESFSARSSRPSAEKLKPRAAAFCLMCACCGAAKRASRTGARAEAANTKSDEKQQRTKTAAAFLAQVLICFRVIRPMLRFPRS